MRAIAVAVLLLAASGTALGDGAITRIEPVAVPIGDITVTDETSKTHSLAAFLPDGAPAIVHFWATWCAPCREELPELADYAESLERSGLRGNLAIVATERGSRERIDRFLAEDVQLPDLNVLQDHEARSGSLFGLFGMPATVLLDAQGRVVGKHAGPLDWNDEEVREELAAHLGG